MANERRPCEGCSRKLPKGSHVNRRFCTRCQKQRKNRRPSKRGRRGRPGPPTKCTPKTIKLYCDAYGLGLTREHSAERAGVTAAAVNDWFARARAALKDAGLSEDEPPTDVLERVPERERPFVTILLESQRVRAESTAALFGVMRRSATGGAHWERNPNYNPEDPESQEYVQTGYVPPDWKAAKHLAAIRHPEYSERYRQEVSGPEGGPVPLGVVITLPPEDDGPPESE